MSRVLVNSFETLRTEKKLATSTSNELPVVLHGITFPSSLDIRTIKEAMNYPPRSNDIVIASYPNAGDDWLQHIVLKLVGRDGNFLAPDVTFKIVPLLERTGTKIADSLYEPRIYKHHLPYHMVKKNTLSKVIYIYRNPEDTFAAYYYHKNRIQGRKGNLEKAFETFSSGRNMEYGRYFEHILSFFRYQKSTNLLLVSFDRLYSDHKQEVLRIASFLDPEFHQYLLESESGLESLLEKTGYENIPHKCSLPHESSFAKRPKIEEETEPQEVIGGGRILLSAAQVQKLHAISANVLKVYLSIWTQPTPTDATETDLDDKENSDRLGNRNPESFKS